VEPILINLVLCEVVDDEVDEVEDDEADLIHLPVI